MIKEMKIPKTLKIGSFDYKIKKVRFVDWKNKKVSGNIDYGNKVMKVKNWKDDRTREETFFHEVAHGLLKELEFNYPQIIKFRNDEQFTHELGLTLRLTFLDLLQKQNE